MLRIKQSEARAQSSLMSNPMKLAQFPFGAHRNLS